VIGCARHSETDEEYVVYRALCGNHGPWVRPKALFVQQVTVEGGVSRALHLLRKRCVHGQRVGPGRLGHGKTVRPTGRESVLADSGRGG